MKTKICSKCGIRKKLIEFYKDKSQKEGYEPLCKKCKLYSLNKKCPDCDKLIANKSSKCRTHAQPKGKTNCNYKHGFYINNKCLKECHYQNNNRCLDCNKKITDKAKRCKQCEIERIKLSKKDKLKYRNKKEKIKKLSNIIYRITCKLRSNISKMIKNNKKYLHTIQLLGCSVEYLKQHLENQFTVGMSWDNYGKWHIDHIRPCASFDLSKPEEQARCFHYTNLQPLWAEENLKKGAKYEKQ